MKSDDTVMSPELLKVYEGNIQAAIEWQAEVSFKAGIKEVTDWLNINTCKLYDEHHIEFYTYIPMDKWQVKLKEWGIK
jgi:hypothetical protein